MRKYFVGKNVAYGASKSNATTMTATTPDLLADGALCVYFMDANGTLLVVSPTTASAGQITIANAIAQAGKSGLSQSRFIIAVGTAAGHKITDHFSLNDVTNGFSKESAADTKHVISQTITPANPGTDSDIYALHVVYHNEEQDMRAYDINGKFADATAVANAFVAKINADKLSQVTASQAAGALVLTSKVIGLAFSTAWDIPSGATAGAKTTTNYALGNGVGAALQAQEKEFATYDGYLNPFDPHLKQFVPQFANVQYDTYLLYLNKTTDAKHMMNAVDEAKREVYVYTPDVMTDTGWDTVFKGLFDADVSETTDAAPAS